MQNFKELSQKIRELKRQYNYEKANVQKQINAVSGKSSREVKAFAMTLPELDDGLWDLLNDDDFAYPTGSVVFGNIPAVERSYLFDTDIIVNLPAYVFLNSLQAVPCGKVSADYIDDMDSMTPIYANRNGKLYNIICMSFEKFEAWRTTTDYMAYLAARPEFEELIQTKWKRVRLFRAFADVLEPVKRSYNQLTPNEARQYKKCAICRREAVNFTNKLKEDEYNRTAVCERCQ